MSSRIGQVRKEERNAARFLTGSILSLAVLIIAVPGRSQERESQLGRLFQVGMPRADVAILLDASLSMRNHRYVEVRQAVVDFTSNLTHNETLSLRIFGDIVGTPLEGRADKVAGNVAEHLPAQPLFQYTDLGLAIMKSLEFFERNGASDVQALLLITDGLHEPPSGSIFSRRFASDPNWQSLRGRASELRSKRQLMVFGLGLGERTDVALLQQVFPTTNVELIVGDASSLIPALRRIRESLLAARLRRALETELTEGRIVTLTARNEIQITGREFVEPITIRNDYRHLPVVIDRIDLKIDSNPTEVISFELDETEGITLAPGQQWQGNLRGSLNTNPPVLSIGRREQAYLATIRIVPVAQFKHQGELTQSGIQSRQPLMPGLSIRAELRERYGVPYRIICGAVFVCVGLIMLVRRRRKIAARRSAAMRARLSERRRITGEIGLWPADQPEPDHGRIDLADLNREKLWVIASTNNLPEIVAAAGREDAIVAVLESSISGARPGVAESGRVEFSIEAAPGHSLAIESDGGFRAAARLTLCDRDLIVIDDRWKMRYSNHRLRTRAEVESARPTEPQARGPLNRKR